MIHLITILAAYAGVQLVILILNLIDEAAAYKPKPTANDSSQEDYSPQSPLPSSEPTFREFSAN